MPLTYGTTQITKREYDIYLALSGGAPTFESADTPSAIKAVRVGAIAEAPTLKTEKGDEITIGTGDIMVISENYNSEFVIYEVTSANYTALRALINEGVDMYLTDCSADTLDGTNISAFATTAEDTGTHLIKLSNAYLYPGLEFIGNDQNKINVSISKEKGVSSSAITITEASTT